MSLKKETQKIVTIFKCAEGTGKPRKHLKEWAEALQPFHLHSSYISKYALLCFLNSFGSQPLCSPLRPPVFTTEICQHFTMPCHCRRFTKGFHLYSFAEDSESTAKLCHICGVKNCYHILLADLQIHSQFSAQSYTRTSLKF